MTIIAALIGAVIGAAIGSLIGALFLMLATRMVVGTKLGYGESYKLVFVVYLVSSLIGAVLVLGTSPEATPELFSMPQLVGWVAGLLFGGYWYGTHIQDSGGATIGFGKGVIVSLVIIAISIAITFLLAILLGGTAAMLGATATPV